MFLFNSQAKYRTGGHFKEKADILVSPSLANQEIMVDDKGIKGHAVQTFRDVDDAMREYSRVTGTKLDPMGPDPKLSDFYVPSSGQRDREIAFVVLRMSATGPVAYKLAK